MRQEDYHDFLNLNLLDYHFTDVFGTDNFMNLLKNLNDNVKKLLDESILVLGKPNTTVPSKLEDLVNNQISTINDIVNSIRGLADKWKSNSNVDQRNLLSQELMKIQNQITNYIEEIYAQKGSRNNLLTVISLIRTYDDKSQNILNEFEAKRNDIDSKIKECENKSSQFDSKISESEKILNDLRTEAAKKVVYSYANIFLEEAEKNSRLKLQKEIWKIFGGAEKWLIAGIISTMVLICFVIVMYNLFPVVNNENIDIPNLITKISLLGIIIFAIRFSFKQYSIHKHLFTLNKHRENVLNSYQLFLSTVGEDDANIRNVLMIEVAKAIYEQGKTGFISEKDGDSGSPSIIEFTKLLTKEKTS